MCRNRRLSASWASCAAPEQPLDKAAGCLLAPAVLVQNKTELGLGERTKLHRASAAGLVEVTWGSLAETPATSDLLWCGFAPVCHLPSLTPASASIACLPSCTGCGTGAPWEGRPGWSLPTLAGLCLPGCTVWDALRAGPAE